LERQRSIYTEWLKRHVSAAGCKYILAALPL